MMMYMGGTRGTQGNGTGTMSNGGMQNLVLGVRGAGSDDEGTLDRENEHLKRRPLEQEYGDEGG